MDALEGTWGYSNGNCRLSAQLLHRNFLATSVGPTDECGNNGAYVGTYSISEGAMFLQYSVTPENTTLPNNQLLFSYSISSDGNVWTLSDFYTGTTVQTFTRQEDSVIQGIYDCSTGGIRGRLSLNGDMYTSFTYGNTTGGNDNVWPYVGIMDFSDDNANFDLSFADFIEFGDYDRGEHIFFPNGELTIETDAFSLSMNNSNLSFTTTCDIPSRAPDVLEGVFIGFDGTCLITNQFTQGIWRHLRYGADDCEAMIIGVYDITDDGRLSLSYSGDSQGYLNGLWIMADFELSDDGNTLNVWGPIPGATDPDASSQQFNSIYERTNAAPGLAVISLELTGPAVDVRFVSLVSLHNPCFDPLTRDTKLARLCIRFRTACLIQFFFIHCFAGRGSDGRSGGADFWLRSCDDYL